MAPDGAKGLGCPSTRDEGSTWAFGRDAVTELRRVER
jgi:hypothetical protein